MEKILNKANSRTQAIRHIHQHLSKNECLAVAHGLFFSKFYYCSSVCLTDILSKSLLKRLTTASNSSLIAALGYRIKDISTSNLHSEARILTPCQKSFYDNAMIFWRIINNCEPDNMYLDLLTQGSHHKRTQTINMRQNHNGNIGKLAFENKLNNILCLLGLTWLD